VIVALIAGLLTVVGVAAPALAAGTVNVSVTPPGETYDGTQVFQPGVDYTLNVQYGKMDNGQQVRIRARRRDDPRLVARGARRQHRGLVDHARRRRHPPHVRQPVPDEHRPGSHRAEVPLR
jgi:hypothetical protein